MIGILARGAVRVGDVEVEAHFTPSYFALLNIPYILAGSRSPLSNLIASLKYEVVPFGSTTPIKSDEIFLQTTSPNQPGYIYGWKWVTLTGLEGYIGTVIGYAFSGMFTSTVSGTLTRFYLRGDCLYTACLTHFFVNLSTFGLVVNSGEPIRFYSTIFTGISGWSVIAKSFYAGTIATVIPNLDFLRNISALFLPYPVASLSSVAPRGYLSTFIFGPYSTDLLVSQGTYEISYYCSVYVSQEVTVSTIRWVGRDTIYITYPSPSTLILYNTLAVALSEPMVPQPGGHQYFTLLIRFVL
jgi:hypothetical protein